MKYLCLAYYDEHRFDALSAAELEAIGRACRPHDEALRATGRLVVQASLGPTRSTACIQPRNGEPVVTDGPFAETKEQLAGFYMIEAQDLDEAIKVAAGIPPARVGSIEVRPIRPIRETVAAAAAAVQGDLRKLVTPQTPQVRSARAGTGSDVPSNARDPAVASGKNPRLWLVMTPHRHPERTRAISAMLSAEILRLRLGMTKGNGCERPKVCRVAKIGETYASA